MALSPIGSSNSAPPPQPPPVRPQQETNEAQEVKKQSEEKVELSRQAQKLANDKENQDQADAAQKATTTFSTRG